MARTFDGLNYLSQSSALVASPPMTFACWVNFASISANSFIMGISSATSTHSSYFAIEMLTASSKIAASISNDAASTTDITAATSTTVTASTWYHVACVFTSATSRTAYLNGAGATTSSVSVTPGTCDSTYIGDIKFNAIVSTGLNGSIAFPSIWNVALSATDILSLSHGIGPQYYHPVGLVSYARLSGGVSPEPDLVKGSWTLVSG